MFCRHNYRNDNNASTTTLLEAKSLTAMETMKAGRPTFMCVLTVNIQSTYAKLRRRGTNYAYPGDMCICRVFGQQGVFKLMHEPFG